MSVSNLLNPETKNQEWSKLYCNDLKALSISAPAVSSEVAHSGTTTNFSTIYRDIGTYPTYIEQPIPECNSSRFSPGSQLYDGTQRGIKVLQAGQYHVSATANISFENISANNSLAVIINGTTILNNLAQTIPSIDTDEEEIVFNVSGTVELTADSFISLGLSSTKPQKSKWLGWNIIVSSA